MDARFLFEQFEAHKMAGLKAHQAGDAKTARKAFLTAAQFLFRLAGHTEEGALKESRLENAGKLVALARRIRENPDGKPGGKRITDEEVGGGVDDAGQANDGDAFLLADKPTTRFDDIKGLDDVKDAIQLRMILPLTHPEKARRYGVKPGGGLLLYGPPGTGKTMLAKAVAGEIDAAFYSVTPADILGRLAGVSEKNVARLFEAARRHPLAVIFMDEVEALIPRRDADEASVMRRLVPQILGEMEGLETEGKNPLLFIGATNKPWALDEAVLRPGRFDEKVYVPLPDRDARLAILSHHCADKPMDADVDLESLTERLDGFSGADIVSLINRVTGKVFMRAITVTEDIPIRMADLELELDGMVPSVNQGALARYDQFRENLV